jgi:hypothetical protein
MRKPLLICAFAVALLQAAVRAENAEVKQLYDDALLILKNNMCRQAMPEEYAASIVKLEKAATAITRRRVKSAWRFSGRGVLRMSK